MAPLEYTAVSIVPLGANTNPVDCMVRVGVGKCPGRGCHGISVRAVPDRETQVMLGYQRRTVASSSTERATTFTPTSASELCWRWRTSFTALQHTVSPGERLRLITARSELLDELARRDPE